MSATKRKENALTIKHLKLLRIMLSTIGIWPGESLGEKVPIIIRCQRYHIIVGIFLVSVGGVYYIYINIDELNVFEKGKCVITTLFAVVITVRVIWTRLKSYGDMTADFILSFHLIHFRYKGGFYEKMFQRIDKYSVYLSAYIWATAFLAVFFFNGTSAYFNFKIGIFSGNRLENSTPEFAVTYSFPGFDPSNYFAFNTIYNIMMTYTASIAICAFDSFKFIKVFQIIGHILILRNSLESFPEVKKRNTIQFRTPNGAVYYAADEIYDEEENEKARVKLVECVEHHKFIVRFSDILSDCYGPTIALNYLFQVITCCIMLLECSTFDPEALMRFIPLSLITFGDLVQKSVGFEILNTVSESLVQSVYDVPWERMNTSNRRSVVILLHRVQTPITVKAMGMATVGVTTMAGILKATFSYYTFLRGV